MILVEKLNFINDYKAQYSESSVFINDSYIIDIWFTKLAEVLRCSLTSGGLE